MYFLFKFFCLLVPRRLSTSKQNQVLTGRRRSSNGCMTVLCTRTTLVKAKASNSQNQTLARYCALLLVVVVVSLLLLLLLLLNKVMMMMIMMFFIIMIC